MDRFLGFAFFEKQFEKSTIGVVEVHLAHRDALLRVVFAFGVFCDDVRVRITIEIFEANLSPSVSIEHAVIVPITASDFERFLFAAYGDEAVSLGGVCVGVNERMVIQ